MEEKKQRIPIAQGLPWTTDEPEVNKALASFGHLFSSRESTDHYFNRQMWSDVNFECYSLQSHHVLIFNVKELVIASLNDVRLRNKPTVTIPLC